MESKKNKGFTLVELLATIGIIAVVFGIAGYYIINTINKSKNESEVVSINNIKKTASVYSEEYEEDVIWNSSGDENMFSCISVEMLVNKGYIKRNDIDKDYINSYIKLVRNSDKAIISEELDSTGTCSELEKWQKISIPTSSNVCKDVTYNGAGQVLINTSSSIASYVTFSGVGSSSSSLAKDAGNYEITVKINNGFVWSDNTRNDKKVTCSIKKATPSLTFNPVKMEGSSATLGLHSLKLKSNVKGNVTFKSSNKEYAIIKETSANVESGVEKGINLDILSTRYLDTYITATINPTDSKNYKEGVAIFTIGNPKRMEVAKPTAAKYCNTLYFNNTDQTLTKAPATGYGFINNVGKNVGKYNVTARLNYGYMWKEDKSINDITITCSIDAPTYSISYNSNGGSTCSSTKVTYGKTYGDNLCKPTRTGYTFDGWYDTSQFTNKIESKTKVDKWEPHQLYAKWTAKKYTINFYGNGSTSGSMTSMSCTYDQKCTLKANTFSKTGYTFAAWTTKSSGADDGYGWKNGWSGTWKFDNGSKGIANNKLNLYARWNECQHEFLLQGTKIHEITWGVYKDSHYPPHKTAYFVYCTKCHMSAIEYNRSIPGGYNVTGIAELLCPYCDVETRACIGAFELNHGKAAVGFYNDN